MIEIPTTAIGTWGAAVVFLNVLITRLGVPIPAVPVLLFAGTAIAHGALSFWSILLAAVVAAMLGDSVWFAAGRVYGRRLFTTLGKLSPLVESKLAQARTMFERFGVPLVSLSKFVPGLAFITPPLMGTTPVDTRIYLTWDVVGTSAWAAFWLLGGAAAERQLRRLVTEARAHGGTVLDLLAAAALIYFVYRLVQRWRFKRWIERTRVSPEQLKSMMRSPTPPVVLDARPSTVRNDEPRKIPGALPLDLDSPGKVDDALLAHDIVVYCVCPNDAAAKDITMKMRQKGFTRIRALRGGLDAWERRGYPVEPLWMPDAATGRTPRAKTRVERKDEPVTVRSFAPRRAGEGGKH
ncbi:VTT domain-containing protein [Paraburkholderia sp.]|uniref:VTT domain-containing protein n=1 Tax=Paraburkholderia sp. TaxID=1926495 RepID=UPI00239E7B96|nr:VTT domain-containing protein [Paraburkholderia sp.]MDE1182256.1 VTT domain-containing protein [Paraburkholderia sp.]